MHGGNVRNISKLGRNSGHLVILVELLGRIGQNFLDVPRIGSPPGSPHLPLDQPGKFEKFECLGTGRFRSPLKVLDGNAQTRLQRLK